MVARVHGGRGWTGHALRAAVAAMALLGVQDGRAESDLLSVTVPVANFRDGPSTKNDVIFTATRYFPVRVTGREGGWVRIRDFENEEAWIAKRLLGTTPCVVIEVKKGNVRDAPSLEGEKVDEVIYGEVFRIAERRGRWLKIATHKKVLGWVRDDLTWGESMKRTTRPNDGNSAS